MTVIQPDEPITKQNLAAEVDRIIAMSRDFESAHDAEDALLLDLVYRFCPSWVCSEIERLKAADFPRFCA